MTVLVTKLSQRGLCWWRILGLYALEFFLEFVLADIVQLPQAIDLPQCELGFAQIAQARLAVILRHILICCRGSLEKFQEFHKGIYTEPAPAGAPRAGAAAPAAACCPGAAPGAPAMSAGPKSPNS